ncbi:MAG: hypothetical protein IKY45_05210 [Clostridia bacterium]|nr:hypothetical protein [Clostridia bacterium]
MPDKKLTDSEIVNLLELLLDKIRAYECKNIFINEASILDILDLINRLQAENERLKRAIKSSKETKQRLRAEIYVKKKLLDIAEERFKKIKTEAYKEFAERLKETNRSVSILRQGDIDNLLKEMVGEDNERKT